MYGYAQDLIISGDLAMQSALEKYEQLGDASEIKGLISSWVMLCVSIF